jgi:hypothetical protein
MQTERYIWWGGMAACMIAYVAALQLGFAVYALPVIMGAALLFMFERGERGAFPFRKRHMVEYQMNYFAFVIMLAIMLNTAPRTLPSGAESLPPLYWAVPMIGAYLVGLYFRRTA